MRALTLILLLAQSLIAAPAVAQTYVWQVCEGVPGRSGPVLSDCRPLRSHVDPQGREIWITATVFSPAVTQGQVLRITGVASSEAWLNEVFLGANGRPGGDARTERPGRYEAEFAVPPSAWRPERSVLTLRLSSFHAGARLARPIGTIRVIPARDALLRSQIAVNLTLFGVLVASAFGFGVIHRLRRTTSSLLLMGMAACGALLAVVEALPFLLDYVYPFHIWRLTGLWLLTVTFGVLLVVYATKGVRGPARQRLRWIAVIAVGLAGLFSSYDLKMLGTLAAAVVVAIAAWALGPRPRLSRGAGLYLASAVTLAAASLAFFAEVFHLLLIASLLVPMLMLHVTRLARDDLSRERALARAASPPDRLAVTTGRRVTLVELSDVVAICGADDYVEVVLLDGRRLLHASRLDHLQTELPSTFVRVHRSAIANLQHAEGLDRDGSSWRLLVRSHGPVRISRARVAEIRSALLPASS